MWVWPRGNINSKYPQSWDINPHIVVLNHMYNQKPVVTILSSLGQQTKFCLVDQMIFYTEL